MSGTGAPSSDEDRAAVEASLGRPPRGGFTVALRDHEGRPVVIENEPFLDDGTPMPTRYWLVDQGLVKAVARLESEGGVSAAEAAVEPLALRRSHERYAEARDAAVERCSGGRAGSPAARPSGGVGGARAGVKCLHAHLAYWLVGAEDPVGAFTAARLGLRRPRSGGRLWPPTGGAEGHGDLVIDSR